MLQQGNCDKEQQDFKGVKRTKNKTLRNFLKHSLIKSEYHQLKFENQYEGARMLRFDNPVFCKAILHHSEKFQGISSTYLIHLKIMKHCQVFP